jgi:pimeloyl-ACP methyl ester carboxylesterase
MLLPATDVIRLCDGRLLEFARYGDPAGVPVVFFHGFVGSHHQASFAHEAALRHGLRLIAPNRPGVGRSSPARRGFISDCVPDIAALADALRLGLFGVIGVSGGVPYALACLARLGGRVRFGGLVSGLGPLVDPTLLARMNPLPRRVLRLSRHLPWLVRAALRLRLRQFRSDPDGFLAGLIRRWSITDGELFRRAEVRATLLADLKEVFLHELAAEGLVQELRLYFHWGFQLDEIAPGARLVLWHGRDDVLVPPVMTLHAASQLPGAEVALLPGGHFTVIDHAEEVVRRTRSALVDFFPGAAQPPLTATPAPLS